MDVIGIHHVAFAHRPKDPIVDQLQELLGLSVSLVELGEGFVERMLPVGSGRGFLQTLECAGSGTVARFVERRGSALHHVALEVANLEASLGELQEAGTRLIDTEPRPGGGETLIAFIHPEEFGGLLIELVEQSGGPGKQEAPK